jgi:hypothetical protein
MSGGCDHAAHPWSKFEASGLDAIDISRSQSGSSCTTKRTPERQLSAKERELMIETANEIDTGICWTEDAIEVDATLVARGLNLPVEQFMAEMQRGIVYSASERGIAEDEGRFRLTFRYRDRVFRLIVTTTGEIIYKRASK